MHKKYKEIVDKLGKNTFTNNFGSDPENSIEEKVLRKEGRD
jgi:hypothetical protein